VSEKSEVVSVDFALPGYQPPWGTPLYWRNEQTVLPAAMLAYINHAAFPKQYPTPSAEQLALVIGFLRYFIDAPCWVDPASLWLPRLRNQAKQMRSVEDVNRWINQCLKFGLDPL
jgi:hypothetical protein